jgi:acyl-CoA synthetase (NDP forming)
MKPDVTPLFRPKRVAIIGASRTPGELKNLVKGGYVFAINPAGVEVEGKPGYRSIREVPEQVGCAFLAIPATAILRRSVRMRRGRRARGGARRGIAKTRGLRLVESGITPN